MKSIVKSALDAFSPAAGTGVSVSTRGGHSDRRMAAHRARRDRERQHPRLARAHCGPEDAALRVVRHRVRPGRPFQARRGRYGASRPWRTCPVPVERMGRVVDEVADLDHGVHVRDRRQPRDGRVPARSQSRRPSTPSSAGGSGACVAIGNKLTVETSGNGRHPGLPLRRFTSFGFRGRPGGIQSSNRCSFTYWNGTRIAWRW